MAISLCLNIAKISMLATGKLSRVVISKSKMFPYRDYANFKRVPKPVKQTI